MFDCTTLFQGKGAIINNFLLYLPKLAQKIISGRD
jgi:hypothetical protein